VKKKLEKGDQVVFKCTNPATGWVKRVAKDGSWADVLWDSGMNFRYVARHKTKDMVKTNPIFNRIATDPMMRVWLPEAFE
jgi:hypothetical protein